jgi:sporulation protein YlmC with PRC-barrel domain
VNGILRATPNTGQLFSGGFIIMAIYSTLGDYRFPNTEDAAHDLRGSKVYGADDDEKLGEVDDIIFDQATGAITFAVIDTGGWLSSKKFIVPPQKLQASAKHEKGFRVNLTKAQIESFPPYDSSDIASEEGWADYEKQYQSKWETGPVMHREGTDRNITPTTQQQIDAGSGSLASAGDAETFEVTPMRTNAEMEVSASGPSLNWTTFEDKLRQRREDVLESSIRMAKQASGENEATRRKAS